MTSVLSSLRQCFDRAGSGLLTFEEDSYHQGHLCLPKAVGANLPPRARLCICMLFYRGSCWSSDSLLEG